MSANTIRIEIVTGSFFFVFFFFFLCVFFCVPIPHSYVARGIPVVQEVGLVATSHVPEIQRRTTIFTTASQVSSGGCGSEESL